MTDIDSKLLPSVIRILAVLGKLEELKTQYDILETLNKSIFSKHNMKDIPGELGVMIFRLFYKKTNQLCLMIGMMGWLSPEEYTGMKFPSLEEFDILFTKTKELAILTDDVLGEDEIPNDKVKVLKEKCTSVQDLHHSLISESVVKVQEKLEDMFGLVFY